MCDTTVYLATTSLVEINVPLATPMEYWLSSVLEHGRRYYILCTFRPASKTEFFDARTNDMSVTPWVKSANGRKYYSKLSRVYKIVAINWIFSCIYYNTNSIILYRAPCTKVSSPHTASIIGNWGWYGVDSNDNYKSWYWMVLNAWQWHENDKRNSNFSF